MRYVCTTIMATACSVYRFPSLHVPGFYGVVRAAMLNIALTTFLAVVLLSAVPERARGKRLLGLVRLPDRDAERQEEAGRHKTPVSEEEEPRQWVEWNVGTRALGIVIWRAEVRPSGMEATSGDQLGRAHGGSGEHLRLRQHGSGMMS